MQKADEDLPRTVTSKSGEMTWEVKCLLHEHKDLSTMPTTQVKAAAVDTGHPNAGKAAADGFQGSLASNASLPTKLQGQ